MDSETPPTATAPDEDLEAYDRRHRRKRGTRKLLILAALAFALFANWHYLLGRGHRAKLRDRDVRIEKLREETAALESTVAEVADYKEKQDDLRQRIRAIERAQAHSATMAQTIEALAIMTEAPAAGVTEAALDLRTGEGGPRGWIHTGRMDEPAVTAYRAALGERPCVTAVEQLPAAPRSGAGPAPFELRLELSPTCVPDAPDENR